MVFVADESVDKQIIDRLRENKYKVIYIAENSPSISDDQVLNLANENKAVLLTADKDFGELIFRRGLIHNGIILTRLEGYPSKAKSKIVTEFISSNEGIIRNSFTVISIAGIRIRRKN